MWYTNQKIFLEYNLIAPPGVNYHKNDWASGSQNLNAQPNWKSLMIILINSIFSNITLFFILISLFFLKITYYPEHLTYK